MSAVRIGLALSGGGFRAAAFHLGVLKRLEELDVLQRIEMLSTVSGGSITGALYALRCAQHGDGRPGSYPVERLIGEIRPLLRSNLRGRALFGDPLRTVRALGSFVVPGLRRMPLVVTELDHILFGGARLPDLPPWIVINATSLATGKAWKFFRDRAGDYMIGATDRTGEIPVAEAVGASAAYPLLVDPYPFHTRWEHLRLDLLDRRWARPPPDDPSAERWRRRYGKREGEAVVLLVDGGVYDNEGLNSLRSAGSTHAIISSTAPAVTDFAGRFEVRALSRVVDVMHGRLGALTRQFAHEITHGADPSRVRQDLLELSSELQARTDAGEVGLQSIADRLQELAAVGWPPRGRQFAATAQVLLHSIDVAHNRSATFDEESYDIPVDDRGLRSELVEEIARVRTDLDAMEDGVLDLLIAQGYFLTDAQVKIAMPDVVAVSTGVADTRGAGVRPSWAWACHVSAAANANAADSAGLLRQAAHRSLPVGRCRSRREMLRLYSGLMAGGLISILLLAIVVAIIL